MATPKDLVKAAAKYLNPARLADITMVFFKNYPR
jgi:hypothetical protein